MPKPSRGLRRKALSPKIIYLDQVRKRYKGSPRGDIRYFVRMETKRASEGQLVKVGGREVRVQGPDFYRYHVGHQRKARRLEREGKIASSRLRAALAGLVSVPQHSVELGRVFIHPTITLGVLLLRASENRQRSMSLTQNPYGPEVQCEINEARRRITVRLDYSHVRWHLEEPPGPPKHRRMVVEQVQRLAQVQKAERKLLEFSAELTPKQFADFLDCQRLQRRYVDFQIGELTESEFEEIMALGRR